MIKPAQVLGQPAMRLVTRDGAEATVLLHGAQIVSWIPAGDVERLYLSPLASAAAGQAVRGGIPIVFPQFAQQGPLPRHGLARDRAWQWVDGQTRDGACIGVLRLTDDDATRAIWPHRFEAELTLNVEGQRLDVELAITNRGDAPLHFTAALHSYLRCDDVERARLHGLYGVEYRDALSGKTQQQELDPIGFAGAIERIYLDLHSPLSLATAFSRLAISAEGFPDAVVWNPGPEHHLADLPADDWRRMLCVEAACVGRPVTLAPGAEWAARQSLQA